MNRRGFFASLAALVAAPSPIPILRSLDAPTKIVITHVPPPLDIRQLLMDNMARDIQRDIDLEFLRDMDRILKTTQTA
jgi:hypothetical protein